MNKFNQIERIKELYKEGGNIINFLKSSTDESQNSLEDILISYDFQAGSYTDIYKTAFKEMNDYSRSIAAEINKLGNFDSILEVGIGEGTTLGPLIKNLEKKPNNILGFDISWSRIKYANNFLTTQMELKNIELFVANLFEISLKNNCIDIVYTSHSIEPNGGKEIEAIKELYRVCNKYLIILEPSYDYGSDEAKQRMIKNGYVTKLYESAIELGYNVVEKRLFDNTRNPLNPTEIIIIKKHFEDKNNAEFICPITKGDLTKHENCYHCKSSLLTYPILYGIPCLTSQNAILTAHFDTCL
jgi:ubiquinone/menaquinone biosynthesis C-methylase UbiE